MNKNLIAEGQAYLHLYLGTECLALFKYPDGSQGTTSQWVNAKLVGMINHCPVVRARDVNGQDWGKDEILDSDEEVQLLLREITSMTDDEKKELWRLIFSQGHGDQFTDRFKEFTGQIRIINEKTYYQVPREVMMQGVERLGIESDTTIWADCDLHLWRHNQHTVTAWLLSKGFDLFGLINSKLAIDSTKRAGGN